MHRLEKNPFHAIIALITFLLASAAPEEDTPCKAMWNCQLTFPEIESILLNCLPRPPIGVLHIPQVISSYDNAREVIEINLKKE